MADIRSFITFEADFPDDATWDEVEEPLLPGGKALADHLVEQLRANGVQTSGAEQHSFYGWSFDATTGGFGFRIVLQYVEPWLLLVQSQSGASVLFTHKEVMQALMDLLAQIHKAVRTSSHITNVRWFSKKEFESNPRQLGADAP